MLIPFFFFWIEFTSQKIFVFSVSRFIISKPPPALKNRQWLLHRG